MTNSNVLKGIKCPQCESEGPFDIVGEAVFLGVTDDGCVNFHEMAWGGENVIVCKGCDHNGMVKHFKEPRCTIITNNVDINLLRKQRDHLLTLSKHDDTQGVINMLDDMLDYAEGFVNG